MSQLNEWCKQLRALFPAKSVHWKAQSTSKDKKRAMAVAYIDSRDVQRRLDEVVGPANWQTKFQIMNDGCIECSLGIWDAEKEQWIWKADVGTAQPGQSGGDGNKTKTAYSDSFKRAAVHWGIGRYLYDLPTQWVPYDDQKKQLNQIPKLPDWAIPREEPAPARPAPAREEAPQVTITAAQASELEKLLKDTGSNRAKFLEYFKAKDVAFLDPHQFSTAHKILQQKLEDQAAAKLEEISL